MPWLQKRINKLTLPQRLVLSFGFGFLCAFAQAPYNFLFLLFLGLGGLYTLLQTTQKPLHGFFLGYFFSFGYFGFGLYWIGNALLVENNPYWWAWPLAISGLPLILGSFYAPLTLLYCKKENTTKLPDYLWFICIFSLCEWLRGNLFTGFPWNLFAYSWSSSPYIMQSVSFMNIYYLNALTIFWATLPAYLIISNDCKKNKTVTFTLGLTVFIGLHIYGYTRLHFTPTQFRDDINLVLVQPSIPQEEKWKSEKILENFQKLISLSKNSEKITNPKTTATYIIWPETAVSYNLFEHPRGKNMIGTMLSSYIENSYIITGTLRHTPENDQYFNSIALIDKSVKTLDIYDKKHLVPFGEYMPLDEFTGLAPVVGFKGFESGKKYRATITPENVGYIPLVCYEIIFPNIIHEIEIQKSDLIINTTNDGWYGISPGPFQHLAQAQFRAIETGLPIARVANTGFSAIIDPYGSILSKSKLFKEEKITHTLPKKIYSTHGFLFDKYSYIVIQIITFLLLLKGRNKTKIPTMVE